MNLEIEPAGNQVAVQFIGSETRDDAFLAVCVGAGKDVGVCARGQTVLVQKYARANGIMVSDDTVICEEYLVAPLQK